MKSASSNGRLVFAVTTLLLFLFARSYGQDEPEAADANPDRGIVVDSGTQATGSEADQPATPQVTTPTTQPPVDSGTQATGGEADQPATPPVTTPATQPPVDGGAQAKGSVANQPATPPTTRTTRPLVPPRPPSGPSIGAQAEVGIEATAELSHRNASVPLICKPANQTEASANLAMGSHHAILGHVAASDRQVSANRSCSTEVKHKWFGYAPFCLFWNRCPDEENWIECGRDDHGDGHYCWFGQKSLCASCA